MRLIAIALITLALTPPGFTQDLPQAEALQATSDDRDKITTTEEPKNNTLTPEEPNAAVLEPTSACPLAAPSGSSEYEIDAWNQICAHSEFNGIDYALRPDGSSQNEAGESNVRPQFSSKFLKRILTDPDYVAARPYPSIQFYNLESLYLDLRERDIPGSIRISTSDDVYVDLTDAKIEGSFKITNSQVGSFYADGLVVGRDFSAWKTRFENDVSIRRATINGYASFSQSTIEGEIDAYEISTGWGFFFENGQAEHLDLGNASIGGDLDFGGSTVGRAAEAEESDTVQIAPDGPEGSIYLSGADIGDNLNVRMSTIHGSFIAQSASVRFLNMDKATVVGHLNAENIYASDSIFMRNGSFSSVSLRHVEIGDNFEASGSTFTGSFLADSAVVGNHFLGRGAAFEDIMLRSIVVGGQMSLNSSTVEGALDMDYAEVGGSVNLRMVDDRPATFANVAFRSAKIGVSLDARGASFSDVFAADQLSVGGNVKFSDDTTMAEVQLRSARIEGNLEMLSSNFLGTIIAEGMRVQGSAFLRDGSTFGNVLLTNSKIDKLLQLQGSRFDGELNLANVTMGSLMLWRGPSRDGTWPAQSAIWGPNASLNLRNARAVALQAQMRSTGTSPGSWVLDDGGNSTLPRDLTGFRYDLLGGFTSDAENDLAQIDDPDALVDWVNTSRLPGMTGYRPQPFHALEAALRNMGAQAAANEVAYARMAHRANTRIAVSFTSDPGTWILQAGALIFDRIFQVFVGFGVYPQLAFFWFVGIVGFGACLARPCLANCAGPGKKVTKLDMLFYSLENAIPLMEPSSDFVGARSDNPWIRAYFNFAKVSGFVLATVLIGVLTFGA
ncbi:hypothetical protein [Sulfitobacter geojensis]|uniref:Membrane-associated oxidoreductase n=1 Tax=Sulfitobacter geojensis TaxID=1342299 RepID=A0AAE2W1U9_9RHOB|nr:hypothetical protein [Sulfitobacter geojensis]MBM1690695.1 hypothetical protein [Sulfitobacter geojensis]MBM1694761.1 hypothetical protein [Sulfitobacter geojensis]MBM1707533.1 hypothetical protein [Sulfitobacter geojensis]MBM1711143.1 hypothetical protein [Sulfitobacter geojensis]MBM1715658.1 hypothetical protein [Sulfitobacter geojensis]